jgi:hypothetical protein
MAFFVRLTFTNIEEIIATTEATLRRNLLAYVRSVLTAGECIDRYNSIIEQLIRNFESDPKSFDWRLVPIRSRAAEEEIVRHEVTDSFAHEQWQGARNAQKRFHNTYSSARRQFDSFFQKECRERPTIPELIEHRKRSGAFWRVCIGRYNRVANQAGDEETIRQFYAACPSFRASILASYVAEYERCVRDEKAGVSYRSGLQDLYSAVYLPYCNDFITDDKKQARCLAAIATEGNLDVNVRSYEDFRNGLMGWKSDSEIPKWVPGQKSAT